MRLNNALCIQMLSITNVINTELSVLREEGVCVMANARSGSMKLGRYLLL